MDQYKTWNVIRVTSINQ